MNAAWYRRNGPAREVLEVGELPKPEPAAGEVLVALHASGVNPSDVKNRAGRKLPYDRIVPHFDGAGLIEAVGAGVDSSRIGERVWVFNAQFERPFGTAAEYIALPSALAVTLPAQTSFAEGACLGIPALTAFQAVHLLGPLGGKTVLIIGAGSGVGYYATQFAARDPGALVIGTVGSAERTRRAYAAGAAAVIDYKHEDVAAKIREITGGRGVDGVIDMDFSTSIKLVSADVLAPYGTMAIFGSNVMAEIGVPFRDLLIRNISLKFFGVHYLSDEDRTRQLDSVTQMLEAGTLIHAIGATFPLERIAEAHEAVEQGAAAGKVIVTLR
jgi:NADPH2:quinone reductase